MVKSDKMKIVHIHYPANGRIKKCVPEEWVGGWESGGGAQVCWGNLVPFYRKEHFFGLESLAQSQTMVKSSRYTSFLSLFYLEVMELNPEGSEMIQVRSRGLN